MEHANSLTATIDQLLDNGAIIKTTDGQTIMWPLEFLPMEATEGMAVKLELNIGQASNQNNGESAKEILNEILRSDNEN
ncbi:MAG: hypothetical protein WCP18_01145 [bacterium]